VSGEKSNRGSDVAFSGSGHVRESAVNQAVAELASVLVRPGASIKEVAGVILDHAKALTSSKHGYVASVDEATGDLVSHTLTDMMGGECTVEGGDIRFPRGPDGSYGGLWGHSLNTGEAFYTNDPPSHESSRGLPEGHVPIKNFLTVPAVMEGRVLGQVALANSPGGYGPSDLDAVRRLADLYALFLQRKGAERQIESLARFPAENPNPVLRIAADGTVIYANRPAGVLLEAWGCRVGEVLPSPWATLVGDALEFLQVRHAEVEHDEGTCSLVFSPVAGAGYVNVYGMDVTERRRASELVRTERDFATAVLDSTEALVIAVDREGRIRRFNGACERLTGYTFSEVEGKPYFDLFLDPGRSQAARKAFEKLAEGVYPKNFVEYWRTRDGSLRLIEWSNSVITGDDGDIRFVVGTGIDVTRHRQMEAYHALTAQLLEELNRPNRGRETLATVTSLIRSVTGFEAVGLRLRKGLDFPYYVTEGFPARFVEAERNLCRTARDGRPAVGPDGEVILECVCGNVLRGSVDPEKPFYTAGGSFWTNRASRLEEDYGQEALGTEIRGTCIQTGYESVALVPIKADFEIVGLLQLNDSRPNRFTVTMIQFLEQIGASIGMALKRQRAEEALKELNETLEERVAERTAALARRAGQLRELAAELSRVEQREKKRLSSVLHDHVQQMLVAAKLKAAMVRRQAPAVAEMISEIEDVLQDVIDRCRSLAVELSPPVLHQEGLPAALEWLAEQMRENHGLRVALDVDSEAGPADESTAILLYNAVRELLLNTLKHAGVAQARVSLKRWGERLFIEVSDKGAGFDPARARSGRVEAGLGLFSIRERLEAAGGTMSIESTPGAGTRVRLVAPVPARRHRAARLGAGENVRR